MNAGPGLLEALRMHRPRDAREMRSLTRMLAEIPQLPDPFDRSRTDTHVTASAIVLGPTGDVLLHRHKRLDLWLQPGGHVHPGESPPDAALRETLEETGVSAVHADAAAVILHVDVHPGPGGHTHFDVRYLLMAHEMSITGPGPGESPDVRWFSPHEARDFADDSLASALAAAIAKFG